MAKIKTGDRVKVVGETSRHHGRTGTVIPKPVGYAMPAPDHVFVFAGETRDAPAGAIGPIHVDKLEAQTDG